MPTLIKLALLSVLIMVSLPSPAVTVANESTLLIESLPPLPLILRAVVSPSTVAVVIVSSVEVPPAKVVLTSTTIDSPPAGCMVAQVAVSSSKR